MALSDCEVRSRYVVFQVHT